MTQAGDWPAAGQGAAREQGILRKPAGHPDYGRQARPAVHTAVL